MAIPADVEEFVEKHIKLMISLVVIFPNTFLSNSSNDKK
jgi:hypothetical protein